VDVVERQRVSTNYTEFDIGHNEHVVDEVEFGNDTVDFCFWTPYSHTSLRCYVRLMDADTDEFLRMGEGELRIADDNDDRSYLSFSGFGYYDEQMTQPVSRCKYEVWLDGEGRTRVTVFV
jgi:hypothetical protein